MKQPAGHGSSPIAVQPIINNSTNVNVNVGGPVVVAGRGVDRVVVHDRRGSSSTPSDWQHNSAFIVIALVLMPLVGLPWMWAAARWKTSTKWVVTGAFFWPLWIRNVMSQNWSQGLKLGAAAVLVLSYLALFTRAAPVAALLVGLPAFIWAIRSASEPEGNPETSLRGAVVDLLDECNEVIGDIERGLGVELLAPDSAVRKQYLRGLELRRQAEDMLSTAHRVDLRAAQQKATDAFTNFRAVRQALNSAVT